MNNMKIIDTFDLLKMLSQAVTERYPDSVPAPNVTFSYMKHNGKFYCAVVMYQKGKKKTICKYEDFCADVAIKNCIKEFLKNFQEPTAISILRVFDLMSC